MASNAAKVGVFVVLSLLLLAGIYVFLEGSLLREPMVPVRAEFDNASGITPGSVVRMAGVKIGEVKKVTLDPVSKRAVVEMLIEQKHTISARDRITIASGGLLPAPYIEIIPAQQPKTRPAGAFHGTSPATVDQLMTQAQGLIKSMNELTQSFQGVVGDPRFTQNIKSSAASLAVASKRGEQIAANLEALSARTPQLMAHLERASRAAEGTMAQAQAAVGENRVRLAQLLDQSRQSIAEVQRTLVEVRGMVADPMTRENLATTLANVRDATANLKEASGSLRQTAADVQGLTSDPKVQTDLRETISGARQTMGEATRLLHRINQIVGSGGDRTAGSRQRLRDIDLQLDVQQMTRPGRPRVDVNATLPIGHGSFTRLGVYDFGESSKLNVQLGRAMGDEAALRYGLHASRLGAGLDLTLPGKGARTKLSADLYGLGDTSLDLRIAQPIRPNLDLTLGVDRLFRDTAPVIGVRWHK